MNKSRRINELARDLEVKSSAILDKLKELGITGKTHSSSVDEDVAVQLRHIFVDGEGTESSSNGRSHEHDGSDDGPSPRQEDSVPRRPGLSGSQAESAIALVTDPVETKEQPTSEQAAPPPPAVEEEKVAPRFGLRPPLASGPIRPPMPSAPRRVFPPPPPAPTGPRAAPSAPVSAPAPVPAPPVSVAPPVVVAPPAAAAPPVDVARQAEVVRQAPQVAPSEPAVTSPVPQQPAQNPRPGVVAPSPVHSAPSQPSVPISSVPRPSPGPAKPIPTALTSQRPGQVLTGPRAPMPPSSAQVPGLTPGAPLIQRPAGMGPRPGAPIAPRPASAPGGTRPAPTTAPSARPALVGQPAQRPIVPPDPKLRERLTQPRPQNPAFAAPPPPPRPGAPLRQPASPTPGRPIYQGPSRPGATPMQGRATPRPGGPTGPGGPPRPGMRPGMHPTSRTPGGLVGPGSPPPMPDQQRRPGAYNRPGGRPQGRRPREADDAEKVLRPMRRSEPAGPPPINRDITVSEGVTVKELSEKLDVKANLVIKKLVDRGIFATINQTLDAQLATELAREFGASTSTVSFETEAMADVEIMEEAKDLQTRAPVVTIMGHVDHGKTSLLDVIREANVAGREAGGITQHIGAYHIEKNGRKIVFIDTPGHEAFTRMRARGAKITDIVVLVVAADDGVMPQTIEAIAHARAAKVPIIVAINKIDRAEAQVDRIKQQLSDRGLLAEDWGGDVVMVPVSAKTKQNLGQLLEMILLVAELQDLKANPSRPAMGTVIESKLDRGRGPVATVLVRNGTLRVGDFFICGDVFGKVRALIDDLGNQVKEVEPSMPVEVLGLDGLPNAGDEFQVVTDTAKAKQIVMYREAKAREIALAKNKRMTLEQLQKQMAQGEVKELNLIIKADVGGSAEVITDTLTNLSTDKVRVRVLQTGVGAINESDVLLASTSEAIIIGFNVKPDRAAAAAAEHEKVDIRLHSIIYNLTDEIKKAMTGLLEPTFKEIYRGKAEVRQTFRVSKVGMVAGCMILDGTITRDCKLRVTRGKDIIVVTRVGSLKRFKDDVSEVRMGMECGIVPDPFGDIQVGDMLEAFITEKVIHVVA